MTSNFDSRWRAQALGGEPDALARLADVGLGPLYRFCLHRVGRNRHLCEDVVQETLARAIAQLDKYDPVRSAGNIFGWLAGLARNEIRRVLSADKTAAGLQRLWVRMDQELLDLYAQLESQPFSDELLARQETRQMVNTVMSQIPPHYTSALEAKYVHGRSVREMAAERGLTEKAVESLLTRARHAFRATFVALARNLNLETVTI